MQDQEKNPWVTKSSKVVYDNPWIGIREDQIINPAGNDGLYGVVSFKNLAIGIVTLDHKGYTHLVGQYRYPLNEYSWEITEGGCLIGEEEPLEAAQRELKEETGLIAAKWTKISRLHTSNSVTDEEGFLYLAEELTAGEADPEETERLSVKKVLLKDAIAMVMNDEITDSLSSIGLLKVGRLKGI
jgi:8-oxo-dGTP pyrophosphatase MutT (NUDIX family)